MNWQVLHRGTDVPEESTARMRIMAHFYHNKRTRCLIGAFLICTCVIANSRDMYLAAAGPTPLRFRFEVPRLDPAKALPALSMSDSVVSTNATNGTNAVNAEVSTVTPPTEMNSRDATTTIVVPENASVPIADPNAVPAKPELPQPQRNGDASLASPQMLLRYFRGGTNEVLFPYTVDFTPPVRENHEDSSAVYISE